jgi:hypothetical protein
LADSISSLSKLRRFAEENAARLPHGSAHGTELT